MTTMLEGPAMSPRSSSPVDADAPVEDLLRSAHALLASAHGRLRAPGDEGASADSLLSVVEESELLLALVTATQMRASVAFRESRIVEQRRAGLARKDVGRGISQEIALARRASPARTANHLALERVLVETMPTTLDLLSGGRISAWAADEVAKASICLGDEDRARVDHDIAPQLPEVSPTRAGALARARGDELDQQAALARNAREVAQRHVSIRPGSDSTVRVSALLPLVEGVAVYKALDDAASTARAQGTAGTRGQHMADALVARVTGLSRPEDVDIEIQLMMTDRALLDDGDDVAWIDGHPVPAGIARRFALFDPDSDSEDDSARRFVRRLFTDPVSAQLTAADARRRRFTGHDRRFVETADRICRTPWCEARIRHMDHVERHTDGGTTSIDNGAGRCESCNYLMEQPGWSARMGGDGASDPSGSPPDRSLTLSTPTGRTFTNDPPPLRWPRPDLGDVVGEVTRDGEG